MDRALQITILILAVIITYVAITTQMKINDIETKLGVNRIAYNTSNNNPTEMSRDVSAGELSSALRSKLSGDHVSELNVKFDQQ